MERVDILVFMENQARYWKSLSDLALIDLPRASNIDQKFFTDRNVPGDFSFEYKEFLFILEF